MEVHKKFVDKLIDQREGTLFDFINDKKYLGLPEPPPELPKEKRFLSEPSAKEFLLKIDQIFYTVDYLEKASLIEISKTSNGSRNADEFFNSINTDVGNKFSSQFDYLRKQLDKKKAWDITIQPGLLKYKANGYRTDEEKREYTNRWFQIGAVILATTLTAIFTGIVDYFI